MSAAQPSCFSTGSTDSARIFTPRLSNSGLILAGAPGSVVQIGVKSFGCEKIAPQESPSHSWRLIVPSLDSAVKSGAVSPIVKLIANFRSSELGLRDSGRKPITSVGNAGIRDFLPPARRQPDSQVEGQVIAGL